MRKPLQGVLNIVRFNRHFYIGVGVLILVLLCLLPFLSTLRQMFLAAGILSAAAVTLISLAASWYIYDYSDLYRLEYLKFNGVKTILNVNAGFDETSEIIATKFPVARLTVCDFYDAEKHTEISLKRARKAYPPYPNTLAVRAEKLPFADNSFERIVVIFAAHEVRDPQERILFFKELSRVLAPNGKIIVTEHLRDLNNFAVYTLGFLHFYSKSSWQHTFAEANLRIIREVKTTPFVTTFILKNHGNTP